MNYYPKGSGMEWVDQILNAVKSSEKSEEFYKHLRTKIQQDKIDELLTKMASYVAYAAKYAVMTIDTNGIVTTKQGDPPWVNMWNAYNEVIRAK